ncbi:hypothetical protein FACS1894139_12290 [Planctomycetales bacterium]|nr:hypothetical protein FACS1894107_02160 [Planctomycetales bacterium]GHT06443.1 hypothetical protein FACS1894139_12290 [Planctomycetales bacterium]
MIKPRTLARRLAMQYCFMCDLNAEWNTWSLSDFLAAHCDLPTAADFAKELVADTVAQHEALDEQIGAVVKHWEVRRIAAVERNILRVALAELRAGKLDKKIIISEAIKLADDFGDKNSGKFVNGLLDALAKNVAANGRQNVRVMIPLLDALAKNVAAKAEFVSHGGAEDPENTL